MSFWAACTSGRIHSLFGTLWWCACARVCVFPCVCVLCVRVSGTRCSIFQPVFIFTSWVSLGNQAASRQRQACGCCHRGRGVLFGWQEHRCAFAVKASSCSLRSTATVCVRTAQCRPCSHCCSSCPIYRTCYVLRVHPLGLVLFFCIVLFFWFPSCDRGGLRDWV